MIKVTSFDIVIHGDESVGIFDGNFTLSPDFYFDDIDEMNEFAEGIRKYFSDFYGDPVSIYPNIDFPPSLKVFRKIAEYSLGFNEFYENTRSITGVSNETLEWFYKVYGVEGKLDEISAIKRFYSDIKARQFS